MPFVARVWHWQSLWWITVTAFTVLLKHHYSIATAADLEWIFQPLAILLELFTGHIFQQDNYSEWVSYNANIRLVKACAGINFMIMSFLVYAWVFRPDSKENTGCLTQFIGQFLLISAAIIAAWATCLLANSLRIIIAMEAADQHWEIAIMGIDSKQLHRLIGMFIYIPLLSLQMTLCHCSISRAVYPAIKELHHNRLFYVPLFLYFIITVFVPIVTGNAFYKPDQFMEHVLHLLGVTLLFAIILKLKRYLLSS